MKEQFNRRAFLQTISITSGAFLCPSPFLNASAQEHAATQDQFFEQFHNPPSSARPFYRWWWNGNRITAEEIRREMKLMKESGAGGVEINPVSLDSDIYPNPPGKALDWLSDEWNEMVRTTTEFGQEQDMIVDMIVGTGWPFGGKFLDPEEWIQGVELEVISVEGPSDIQRKFPSPNGDNEKLIQLKLFPKEIENLGSVIDLFEKVSNDGTFAYSVPEGKHDLYVLTWRRKFREVMHGAPGADGPVLDHFNQSAVEHYLNRMSEELGPHLGGKLGNGLRSLFCDSIELAGANWTSDFSAEFKKRRGYEIESYLPLIMNRNVKVIGDFEDIIHRVRYDHSLTLAELFMERFILPYHEWCNRNGTQSRYQAYGHPWLYTNLLSGYLVPDIPEGDQWLFNAGWVRGAVLDDIRYAIWNKYTSSGAHLKGRKIASCEAMTNTRGVFQASLEYMKQGTDINIVTGINHFVLHGFNYSPPEAGFPGWIRYGCYYNEQNPIWPYMRHWMDYVARLCSVFQNSNPTAQVAILGPTPDIWSEAGLDRNAFNTKPWYLHELWQALNHHGYYADYVNGQVIEEAKYEKGKLQHGPMEYEILIVCDAETIQPETAVALQRFAENGGKILFVGKLPHRSPGLSDKDGKDALVITAMNNIQNIESESIQVVEKPKQDLLLQWAGEMMSEMKVAPAFEHSNPDPKLFFNHHTNGDRDIYFLVNMDRERRIDLQVTFPTGRKTAWRWDPETGERSVFPYKGFPVEYDKNVFEIQLEPLESLLLVFESDRFGKPEKPLEADSSRSLEMIGPWAVDLFPVQGEPFSEQFEQLFDFSKDWNLYTFSGKAVYRTSLNWPFGTDNMKQFRLELGKVNEIAEVKLNGKTIGVSWWGSPFVDFPVEYLEEGVNSLEIHVTTLAYNYCRSLENNTAAQVWVQRCRSKELLPSGLLGPVRISALQ